jgi:hypothetical protein
MSINSGGITVTLGAGGGAYIFDTPLEAGFSASDRKADDELQRVVARIHEIIDEPGS